MSATPRDLVAAFDGTGLFHAYGPATDAATIAGLFGDDEESTAATNYLYSAILHQGTPWTATVPVVDLLLRCLPLVGEASVRTEILEFVTDVAEVPLAQDPSADLDVARAEIEEAIAAIGPRAVAEWERIERDGADDAYELAFADDDVANVMYLRTLLALCLARPRWAEAVLPSVDDPDPTTALVAARAVATCDGRRAPELAARLTERAASTAPAWQRAYAVHVLGRLGEDVTRFLASEDLAVRFEAAMAPGLADDAGADGVLMAALRDPAAVDAAFQDGPPLGEWAPSTLAVPRIVARAGASPAFGAEDLVDVALASVRHTGHLPGDWAWGRFLGPILRGAVGGEPLDAAARRYLATLVELDPDATSVWDPVNGNNGLVFRDAGLPRDRASCRALAQGAPWSAPDPG